MMFEAL